MERRGKPPRMYESSASEDRRRGASDSSLEWTVSTAPPCTVTCVTSSSKALVSAYHSFAPISYVYNSFRIGAKLRYALTTALDEEVTQVTVHGGVVLTVHPGEESPAPRRRSSLAEDTYMRGGFPRRSKNTRQGRGVAHGRDPWWRPTSDQFSAMADSALSFLVTVVQPWGNRGARQEIYMVEVEVRASKRP